MDYWRGCVCEQLRWEDRGSMMDRRMYMRMGADKGI